MRGRRVAAVQFLVRPSVDHVRGQVHSADAGQLIRGRSLLFDDRALDRDVPGGDLRLLDGDAPTVAGGADSVYDLRWGWREMHSTGDVGWMTAPLPVEIPGRGLST